MDFKLFLFACALACTSAADRVTRVGHDIKPSASGVDNVPGSMFILDRGIETEGVVFAFSAFFRSNSPVRFQIWRPSNSSKMDFVLVAEIRHIPSVEYSREDIYIESKLLDLCIHVQVGDRFGILMEDSPGAVAYTFQASSPTALGVTLKNTSAPFMPGDHVSFGSLTFPYDFSTTAFIDSKVADYNMVDSDVMVKCPKGLLIPSYTTGDNDNATPEPVTGRPGDTGAQGETGLQGPRGFIGATGQMGEDGQPGAAGPQGADGDAGSKGDVGATGAQGEKGDRGERGPAGPAITVDGDAVAVVHDEGAMSVFSSPVFSLAVAAWLAVVTLMLIILVAVVVTINRRRNRRNSSSAAEDKERAIEEGHAALEGGHAALDARMSYTPEPMERRNTLGPHDPAWMSTLKTESESHVTNQTITDDDSSSGGTAAGATPYSSYMNCTDANSETDLVSNNNTAFSRPEMVY